MLSMLFALVVMPQDISAKPWRSASALANMSSGALGGLSSNSSAIGSNALQSSSSSSQQKANKSSADKKAADDAKARKRAAQDSMQKMMDHLRCGNKPC